MTSLQKKFRNRKSLDINNMANEMVYEERNYAEREYVTVILRQYRHEILVV